MAKVSVPHLVQRLIELNGGSAERTAAQLGTSSSNISRWSGGKVRPRPQMENRLRAIVSGPNEATPRSEQQYSDARIVQLENAISGTLDALREEFHRTAPTSKRQEVLDVVSALVFAHVSSIDHEQRGIGRHLLSEGRTAAKSLNDFMSDALRQYLPAISQLGDAKEQIPLNKFFSHLSTTEDQFANNLLTIFDQQASAFRALHQSGRDDIINEVFSRFMSTSFVDEKEMGQYLTPPEIVRFMIEVGFSLLQGDQREALLDPYEFENAGIILDPSCGVGSFLAETTRFVFNLVRARNNDALSERWLSNFVGNKIVGLDKSERMIRLAMLNLGLFGSSAAAVRRANALARVGPDGTFCNSLNGKIDLIFTNPPFGATYSGDELHGFELSRGRTKSESEVLFLERYIEWLAPGGIVVTVVPDSILVNKGPYFALRAWLKDRCDVLCVFSLPSLAFGAAGTNTKTSILALRKRGRGAPCEKAYLGIAREIGYDVATRNGQRRRIRHFRSDLTALVGELQGTQPFRLGRRLTLEANAERWDAPFHVGMPDRVEMVITNAAASLLKVSDVATLVDERIDPRTNGVDDFDYVEISDIDIRTGLVGSKRISAAESPSRARKRIQSDDVLVSTVRPERGAVGLTPKLLNGAICSTGLAVLRCSSIHPLGLVWLLKTDLVRSQMLRNNIGIAYPAITETSCLDLVLPITRDAIDALNSSAMTLAASQEQFEAQQRALLASVQKLDRLVFTAENS